MTIIKYDNIKVSKETLKTVLDNIKYNELIVYYYEKFIKEQEGLKNFGDVYIDIDLLKDKKDRLVNCNKFWLVDVFRKNKIKNFKKTNLCRDKFCNNCKKLKQAQRMAKYIPELEKYNNNLYHLVLTVPNVTGDKLRETIKKMSSSFRKLMYYIRGERIIKGYEFLSDIGYLGCVRTLEVTYKGDEYHPHYHVGLVATNVKMDKKHVNKYSYSYGVFTNKFSDVEILIQKIWYLIMNNKRITADNIKNLECGYSCKMDKFEEGDFYELFKYIVKDQSEDSFMTYDNFKDLYYSLYNIKQIQGYGCLYSINDNFDEDLFNEMYDEYIKQLYESEKPQEIVEALKDLYKDNEYILISKKSYINYLRKIGKF